MSQSTVDLAIFHFRNRRVRTVNQAGEAWFVAADVAKILGYRDAANMVRRLEEEDRGTRSVSTPSGDQQMTIVSEPGIYMAVFGSRVPEAMAFKRWLARDVIPAIRRTGKYVAPDHVRQMLGLELERTELETEADRERWRAEELQQQLDNVLADRDRWRRKAYALECDHPKREDDGSCTYGKGCSFYR